MTEAETAYVAGVFEGEACFDVNVGSTVRRHPRIRMEMCDKDVVERIHALVGGTLSYPKHRNPDKWRSTALLSVNGRKNVEPLLRSIRPWMGERRRDKIDELLAAYDA